MAPINNDIVLFQKEEDSSYSAELSQLVCIKDRYLAVTVHHCYGSSISGVSDWLSVGTAICG